MIEITSTELRKHIGKYLDLAMQGEERVLVRHRNKGTFAITPAIESRDMVRSIKKTELEAYLDQPEIRESIKRSEEDFAAGRYREITSTKELWEGIR
ncbi:MAG: type II toxin-antitoxin system prevent-host-death family antitoxin [Chlorobium sp.]|jgi:prevent-host-death family protein